jgi:hypothetical protein
MGKLIGLIAIVFLLYKCTGGGFGTEKIFGPPDELPLSRYEDVYVHVWFQFPDNEKLYDLGRTKGAASCGNIAHDYAHSKGLSGNSEWSYVCCTEEGESNCYRKIR